MFPGEQPSGEDQSDSPRVDSRSHGGPDGSVTVPHCPNGGSHLPAVLAGGAEQDWETNKTPSSLPHLLLSPRLRAQLADPMFGVTRSQFSELRLMLLLPLHCTLLCGFHFKEAVMSAASFGFGLIFFPLYCYSFVALYFL